MANLNGFNANDVEPNADFEPIPAGRYLATVIDSQMKPTKNGNGSYLELTFEVLEDPYKGRRLWARLNLENPNPKTVQIARGELSALCRAVGVLAPNDSVELHNLPLLLNVKLKRRKNTDELQNEIRGFSKKEAPAAQPQQATTNTPPWRR